MSGGEQQMLAVGRAFMSGRQDHAPGRALHGARPAADDERLRGPQGDQPAEGTTILLVEQNARLALQFAQRGYVIENGRLVLEGSSKELLENADVRKAYLGG